MHVLTLQRLYESSLLKKFWEQVWIILYEPKCIIWFITLNAKVHNSTASDSQHNISIRGWHVIAFLFWQTLTAIAKLKQLQWHNICWTWSDYPVCTMAVLCLVYFPLSLKLNAYCVLLLFSSVDYTCIPLQTLGQSHHLTFCFVIKSVYYFTFETTCTKHIPFIGCRTLVKLWSIDLKYTKMYMYVYNSTNVFYGQKLTCLPCN